MKLTALNTAWDFKQHCPEIALLPLVCFEPHSQSLPLGTDSLLMSMIAKGVAEKLDVPSFLMPTWPYGTSGHLAGQPGTIYLDFKTLWHVVRDIATSLNERGIHKVVVLNNHGSPMTATSIPIGNFVVKTAVRQLNYEIPNIQAIWVQPFSASRDRLMTLFSSADKELHVGAVEVSLLMHLFPKRKWSLPEDYSPELSPAYLEFGQLQRFSPNGVWGKPSEADREKGREAMDIIVAETVNYINTTYQKLEDLRGEVRESN